MARRTTGIGDATPPSRASRSTANNLSQDKDESRRVATSFKLLKPNADYLKLLKIKTGIDQRELLDEAIELLREKYGEV